MVAAGQRPITLPNEAMRDMMDEKADFLLVPAYTEDGRQTKPQTWHAEGVCIAVLSSAFRLPSQIPIDIKIFPKKYEWWCQPLLRVRPCRRRQHSLMRTAGVRCAAHYGTITSRSPSGQTNGAYRA